jgi:hypothetical protein
VTELAKGGEENAAMRKVAICVFLLLVFVAFLGVPRPVQSNPPIVPATAGIRLLPIATPTPAEALNSMLVYLTYPTLWILLLGYLLTLAIEVVFIHWFTRKYRVPGEHPWALWRLIVVVNTITFPLTQVLVVLIGSYIGWSKVILAELLPLVAEYLAYQWRIPRLHQDGLFVRVPSALRLVVMTVCANALTFGIGLLLGWFAGVS